MKVCITVENNFTFDVRAYKEARSLAHAGYKVTVVAQKYGKVKHCEHKDGFEIIRIGGQSYIKRLFNTCDAFLKKLFARKSEVSSKNDERASAGQVRNISLPRLLWWWVSFRISVTIKLIRTKAKIYHAHAPGTLLPAYIAAKINKAKLIYDAHELHSEMDKTTPSSTFIRKLEMFIEKMLIKKANAVITVSESISKKLGEIYGIKPPLVLVNCPFYKYVKKNNLLRDKLGIKDAVRIVLYQGNSFVPNRGLEQIVEASQYLENCVVVLLGDGPLKPKLMGLVNKKSLYDKVKFLPSVPNKDLLNYTASADIGINLPLKSCINFYYSLPNKLFEYLMVGLPVVMSDFPDMKAIIEKYDVGKVVNPVSVNGIADAINELIGDSSKFTQIRNNAFKIAKTKYNWNIESKNLKTLYHGLMDSVTTVQKKNILYIESGIGFGGAVTCLAALLKKLDKNKYFHLVLSSHNDKSSKDIIQSAGAKFIYVPKYKRPQYLNRMIQVVSKYGKLGKTILLSFVVLGESLLMLPYLFKVLRLVKRHKIEIIYMNNNITLNLEGVIASQVFKIPCIAHLRGSEYPSIEAKIASKYIKYFIATSDFVKKSLLNIEVPQNKLRTIYDGVDVKDCLLKSDFVQCENIKDYKCGQFNVGLIGCIVDWKGHDVFIEAANILVNELNHKECKYFIVGGMPRENGTLKKQLEKRASSCGLSDHVIFTGHQANVFPFISKMDIIVHASIKPEPFGRVIIEAMVLGKPVIATKMGGPLEIIDDGVNGILIPANSPQMLANTIHELLNNRDKVTSISQEAIKTINAKFNMEKTVKEIENIFEEVT